MAWDVDWSHEGNEDRGFGIEISEASCEMTARRLEAMQPSVFAAEGAR